MADTYAKPSRGRIKQVKTHLKNLTKGSQTVTDFLQTVKARADELAILGAPMEEDDLKEKIQDGLGYEYKELVRAVQARDTPITFDELREKLLNYEAALPGTKSEPAQFLASENLAHRSNNGWCPSNLSNNRNNNTGWRPSLNYTNNTPAYNTGPNSSRNTRPPRPYLGHCQICGI